MNLPPALSGEELQFHHVGVACRDLDSERNALLPLGYLPAGDEFTDPQQGIVGQFLEGPGPRLELLTPLARSETLTPWLQGRAKMYHLAYEVPALDVAVRRVLDSGARSISAPVPAVAFAQRPICFLMLRNLLMVELIEGLAPE
jgi:methylmalonyl-CoA/ethylmalonyl-CoA epimerase